MKIDYSYLNQSQGNDQFKSSKRKGMDSCEFILVLFGKLRTRLLWSECRWKGKRDSKVYINPFLKLRIFGVTVANLQWLPFEFWLLSHRTSSWTKCNQKKTKKKEETQGLKVFYETSIFEPQKNHVELLNKTICVKLVLFNF